jgi:hypothetical protein
MKVVRRFSDSFHANMAKAILDAEGIESQVIGSVLEAAYADVGFGFSEGIELMVLDDAMAESADQLLRSKGIDHGI